MPMIHSKKCSSKSVGGVSQESHCLIKAMFFDWTSVGRHRLSVVVTGDIGRGYGEGGRTRDRIMRVMCLRKRSFNKKM